MKQSTAIKIAAGVAAATIGGLFLYSRATRPPVINPNVPQPAKPVDLTRYTGTWYELARHENRFQKGMDSVTADYGLEPGGKVSIVNSGIRAGETERDVSEGTAIVADEDTGAKLKVSFFGPLYTGDYWVLDHGDDYDWSIVGEPSGRYLWLLARDPRPDPALLQRLLTRVEELGYDRWALRITQQGVMDRIAITVTGGCQCGAVRYRATAMVDNAHLCHCRMCQKATGGLFAALVAAPNDALIWTRGTPATFRSSAHVDRGFCATCGTPLFHRGDTGRTNLTIGSLDDPTAFPPRVQMGSESRMPWFLTLPAVEDEGATEAQDPDWAAAIAASNRRAPDHDGR